MSVIDINCDLGEGIDEEGLLRDAALMPFIQSANIACGYHAGNATTMYEVGKLAVRHGVKIGAHPGFNDRLNFGRTPHYLTKPELHLLITRQLEDLKKAIKPLNTVISHVKPHGALYNMAVKEEQMAEVIVQAMKTFDPSLALMGLPNSALEKAAKKADIPFIREGFADRRYQADGTLVPRSEKNATIEEVEELRIHVKQLLATQPIDTICIHSDGPNAKIFAQTLYQLLNHEDN
jgi:UPF0271 protein